MAWRARWRGVLLASSLVAAGVVAPVPTAAMSRVERHAPLLSLIDFIWLARQEKGAGDAMIDLAARASRLAPRSYEVHWRMARSYWWLAHAAREEAKRRDWARAGMDWGHRAAELNGAAVEGHYYEALCLGEYATVVGVPTAVLEGVAGRIEGAALRAHAIDPTYDAGGPMILLGRFYFMLPWPKRDLERSARYLEEARERVPATLLARVYLAETYRAQGKNDAARGELLYVARAGPQPLRRLANEKLREWFS